MNQKTKIVATIGPATWDDEVIVEMISNGFAIARINASFADFKEIERVSNQMRRISPRVTVMLDLMGHKIRVTGFEDDKPFKKGDELILVSEGVTSNKPNVIQVTYPTLETDISRGAKILLDDGNIQLVVKDIQDKLVITEVQNDGILKRRKTVNTPGTHLNFPGLLKKDEEDLRFALENNLVDLVAASFVRNKEDVRLIKDIIGDKNIRVIAKIEDYEGAENFDEILEVVDGIMIGRGDLGVELPLEKVPILQKQFIYKCRQAGKPVIVATQMLESMKENPRATRAEISDVANAVMDGTDAVMLSAETSMGKYPTLAVKTMAEVATEAERFMIPQIVEGNTRSDPSTDALGKHIYAISDELNLAAIIVLSVKGHTVGSIARHRLSIPIFEVSNNPTVIRQNQLYRGVTGFYIQDLKKDRDQIVKQAVDIVYGSGHLEINDKVGVLGGSTITTKGVDSMFEIVDVKTMLEL
jgi:pyruvate kinase